MRRFILAAIALSLATGCASQQKNKELAAAPQAPSASVSRNHYANAEEWYWSAMAPEKIQILESLGAPGALKHEFAECFWHTYWGKLSADEQAALNGYAQGITPLSPSSGMGKATLDKIAEVSFEAMQPYCPQTMSAMQPYWLKAAHKGF